MNKFNFYNQKEITKMLLKDERLVYVDNGMEEIAIRYKDIPDFIVDYNNKMGQTDLTFYEYGACSMSPIITTFGYFLNKCDSDVREDIIERLIDVQNGAKIKPYKIIDERDLAEVEDKLGIENTEKGNSKENIERFSFYKESKKKDLIMLDDFCEFNDFRPVRINDNKFNLLDLETERLSEEKDCTFDELVDMVIGRMVDHFRDYELECIDRQSIDYGWKLYNIAKKYTIKNEQNETWLEGFKKELDDGEERLKTSYVKCLIEWKDDETQDVVIIKTTEDFIEEEDDSIFFYGLSLNEIKKIIENNEYIGNEWKILKVLEESEEI